MREIWCLEVGKIFEKISALFSLENGCNVKVRERGYLKKKGRENEREWDPLGRMASYLLVEVRVNHGEAERPPSHGGHVPLREGLQVGLLSFRFSPRAPLTFFNSPLASELGIHIRFRIKNRNSLTHEDDYESLTNGCELDLIYEDEDNML